MRSKLPLAIQGSLALLLVTPGLAMGAVHPPVLAIYVALAAATLALLAFDGSYHRQCRVDLPLALFLVLTAFTALQLLPLPAGLVRLLSPNAHAIRAAAVAPLGLGAPSWMPLSLDTSFTLAELGKMIIYIGVYLGTCAWTRRHGSTAVLRLVMIAGLAVAAVFLAHQVLMLDKVYGWYKPLHRTFGRNTWAPLVNPNHLAALLGLSTTVTIGRALAARTRSERMLLIGISALSGASLLITLSRGGIAAFIAGQCLFVLLRVLGRLTGNDRQEGRRQHLAWLPIGLVATLGLGLFVAQDAIIGEFVEGDARKIELVTEGLPLVGSFPATGVGRGAFWVGFPQVSDLSARITFTHAENAVVQLLADWGVVFGGLALLVPA
ncbi:MAG: O-antigen ligase family protein, partial [Deltaproteobacteria bacterium]|nr:O-antigen ligase family protein [Deltaproteobacteria bacterium]